jgi:hypothetical protein
MSSTVVNPSNTKPSPREKEEPRVYKLNTSHRCDKCGAQAYVDVILNSGLNLLFCKHHYNKYELALMPVADPDAINDESDRLYDVNRLVGTENN